MMCYYPPSGYIVFSLRKLKFQEGWGLYVRAVGREPDNPNTLFWQTSVNDCFWLIFYFGNLFVFGCLFTIIKKNGPFLVKKMFIEIILCNPMTYIFKGHVKTVNIYMVKFTVSILNTLKIMGFCKNKVDT